jgi:IS1 family transposase
MNRLPAAKRIQILSLLCEGASMRSVSRLADVSINTVSRLLIDAGKACTEFHDEMVRGVRSKRVQVDEIWSFTYAKAKQVPNAKAAPDGAGDTWTWTALDADSKLIVSWLVGARDAEYANAFMNDVAERVSTRIQLTSDGHKPYLVAVEDAFGADIDYAILQKIYGQEANPEKRYSPAGTRIRVTSPRPMSSGRTSRCACTCAASLGSRTPSARNSRTTFTWWRSTPCSTTGRRFTRRCAQRPRWPQG